MPRNVFRRREPVEPGPRKGRMLLVSIILALAFGGLLVRAWQLQVDRHEHYVQRSAGQHLTRITLRASRGAIHDRHGRELALSADVPSVFAVPRDVRDPADVERLATELSAILGLDADRLRRQLSGRGAFVWLKRHVTPAEAEQVTALDHPAILLRDEPRRFYPNRSLAGALLGFAGIDGDGLEGVERDFDRYLKGRSYELEVVRDARGRKAMPTGGVPIEHLAGYDVELSIDARIQQVAEATLRNQVREMEAKSGVVVVLDPRTGDVLALAQTPDFDPNLFRQAEPGDWRNRALTDVLEPGSTVKPLLIAAALDTGKVRADAVWDGFKGRLKVGRKVIRDVHGVDELTTLEIIQRSSNVGAVQVAQRIGKETYHRYLRAYGFGQPVGLGLRGEQVGDLRGPRKWGQIHLATFSYGYGFSVTPVQMAAAAAAIANGGVMMKPRLLRRVLDVRGNVVESFPPRALRRVVGAEAAADATRGMIMVTQKGGTGRRARVPGYVVAGKTGTAHKVDPLIGGYSSKKVRSSFVGFVPAQDPRLVIYVNVDEPQQAQYGGVVAAPIFAGIAREVLPYLGVEPTEPYAPDDDEEIEDWEDVAEGIDPQARPWWYEEAVLAGAPQHLVVPDLSGAPLAEVVRRAAELKLQLRIEGSGVVVSQTPQAGALLPPDSTVLVSLDLPGRPPAAGGAQ
ncbi:MAG: transpeptidase family protein [Myxococcales bacterium]|nr:transpeptidase family protein [Myxococcales bacterium]